MEDTEVWDGKIIYWRIQSIGMERLLIGGYRG
jgi:hypothetical protein